MGVDWRFWCRLCGSNSGEHVNMFFKEEQPSIQLPAIIQKHLMISVRENDETPTVVCYDCLNFCVRLNDFAERSERVDRMYNELLLNTLRKIDYDIDQVRSQYCAEDDDIIQSNLISPKKENNEDDDLYGNHCTDNSAQKVNTKKQKADISMVLKRKRGRPKKVDALLKADVSDEEEDLFLTEEHVSVEINCKSKEHIAKGESESTDGSTESEANPPEKKKRGRKKGSTNAAPKKQKNCKTFDCCFCDLIFESRFHVNQHKLAMHPDEKVKRSSKTSPLARSFICEECGKTYCTKFQLKEHQITHSDESPYECKTCNKQFKSSQTLKIHEDTHNTTAYVCPHCGITLNTKRTLNMHLVVHSDVKKYKCQYCGNEYKRSKSLKAHLILHTGLRPYSCPWCDKTFANGSNCRKHKKLSHPVELAASEAAGEVLTSTQLPKLRYLQPLCQLEDLGLEYESVVMGPVDDASDETTYIQIADPDEEEYDEKPDVPELEIEFIES